MKDANKFHKLPLGLMDYPGNYQPILLELNKIDRRRRIEKGFYDYASKKFYLADGITEVHPRGWFHLPEQQ